MTLVSWALTISTQGVVDPLESSFSFAYTERDRWYQKRLPRSRHFFFTVSTGNRIQGSGDTSIERDVTIGKFTKSIAISLVSWSLDTTPWIFVRNQNRGGCYANRRAFTRRDNCFSSEHAADERTPRAVSVLRDRVTESCDRR